MLAGFLEYPNKIPRSKRGIKLILSWSKSFKDKRGIFNFYATFELLISIGEMPERLNGAVSKTVVRVTVPRVRIPLSPLYPLIVNRYPLIVIR